MNLLPDADSLLLVAGVGMLLHLVCSAWLRSIIGPNPTLVTALFGSPALGDFVASPWLLRGRYFLPWTAAPFELRDCRLQTRVLFWIARFAAMLLFVGAMAFLIRSFMDAGGS
jgi:hypothetical protein